MLALIYPPSTQFQAFFLDVVGKSHASIIPFLKVATLESAAEPEDPCATWLSRKEALEVRFYQWLLFKMSELRLNYGPHVTLVLRDCQ
jgi:hypothetical protein